MNRLRAWLTPPTFEDELRTEQAYLLHVIVWALICVPLPFMLYSLFFMPENASRAFAQTIFGETVNILLLVMLRRGHVQAASIVQVSAFWFFFTISAATSSGVQGEPYLLGFALVIVIAGLLLGRKGAFIFTVLALLSGGAMVYGSTRGWIGTGFENPPLSTWVVSLILFPVVALLQHLGARSIRNALARARASEEKYRLISRVSSDYTFSTELDGEGHMRLNWVAGAFESMTGYTYEEYVARGGWRAHLHPEDVEQDAQALEQLKINQPVIHDIRTFTSRGELQWVRVFAHPVLDHGRLVRIVGAVQNIHEQKLAEMQEARRRALLEKVVVLGQQVTEVKDLRATLIEIWHGIREQLEFDRVGIYLHDLDDNSVSGTFGTDAQGQMQEEFNSRIDLTRNTIETHAFLQVLNSGLYLTRNYQTDHNIPRGHIMDRVRDYAAVAARAGERPVAVLCVDNVLSQRPIAEEQLEALRLFAGYAGLAIENSRLNSALQNELLRQKQAEEREVHRRIMLEKVVKLGKLVTEVTDLRHTLERIWHGVHDELGFDRLAIFLYDQDSHSVRGTLGTSNTGETVEEWEYSRTLHQDQPTSFTRALEQPDGVFFTNNFSADFNIPEGHEMYAVRDFAAVTAWGGDKPVAIITVDNLPSQRAIGTEQLEALRLFAGYAGLAIENARLNAALENDLNHRKTLIEELEMKNVELERFTYTVSHDLKSPLVTITGFLGFLEQDALAGRIEKMQGNIRRINNAAHKMQDLLNDLLELSRIGRLMNPPEDVPFQEIVHEAVDRVRGRLDEINAIVEIQTELPVVRGDRVRLVEVVQNLLENAVKYSKPHTRTRIEIGNSRDELQSHVFFVRDNGIGIAREYHDQIFGLFNQLDPRVEGTGIGLTLVKRIIEVHGGRIWVESEVGKGTTFHFTLQDKLTKE